MTSLGVISAIENTLQSPSRVLEQSFNSISKALFMYPLYSELTKHPVHVSSVAGWNNLLFQQGSHVTLPYIIYVKQTTHVHTLQSAYDI